MLVQCGVTVLITGATSGLGLALARLYAPTANLILVGRKPLETLPDPLFTPETYCRCDLKKPTCADVIADFLAAKGIDTLELLIHNAGLGYYGEPGAQSSASVDALLDVNLYAPVSITHALLPRLIQAKGKLVFISSISAALPAADYAVYAASKAALGGFARNVRLELGDKVGVQALYPGAIRTDMHAKSGVPVGQFKPERFPSAEQVAEQAFRAIGTDRAEVTLGFGNRLLRGAGRYLQGPLDAVMRRAQR